MGGGSEIPIQLEYFTIGYKNNLNGQSDLSEDPNSLQFVLWERRILGS